MNIDNDVEAVLVEHGIDKTVAALSRYLDRREIPKPYRERLAEILAGTAGDQKSHVRHD
jgi:hypothetical protein